MLIFSLVVALLLVLHKPLTWSRGMNLFLAVLLGLALALGWALVDVFVLGRVS
jgi:hypothetical protein